MLESTNVIKESENRSKRASSILASLQRFESFQNSRATSRVTSRAASRIPSLAPTMLDIDISQVTEEPDYSFTIQTA
jgi:hypothetical protein